MPVPAEGGPFMPLGQLRRMQRCASVPGLVDHIADQNEVYSAASDIKYDAKVDGADLGQLLADWGNAPRQDIPPSDCPLALIIP